MEYMESVDIFKEHGILIEFLVLNVHKSANRKLSSSDVKIAGSPVDRGFPFCVLAKCLQIL